MGMELPPSNMYDWVVNNDTALVAEQHARRVAAFRTDFHDRLAACCAPQNGYGWVIFNGEMLDGSVASLARREVLIAARPRNQVVQEMGYAVPLIRLITNEPITADDGSLSYLTEDVSILENGRAVYLVDAVQVQDEHGERAADLGKVLAHSPSPLFFANEQNELFISGGAGAVTPYVMFEVVKDARSFMVHPYGGQKGGSIEHDIFGLDRAQEILESVRDLDPSHAFDGTV
jgi:hypothetical protein